MSRNTRWVYAAINVQSFLLSFILIRVEKKSTAQGDENTAAETQTNEIISGLAAF